MRYVLYVGFDGFFVSVLRAADAALRGRPLVVHRSGDVLDSCPEARARGALPGLKLKAAKAILSGASFVPWTPEPFVEPSRRWLDRCVPYAGAIEPDGFQAAWIDLSPHPRPEDLARRLADEIGASYAAAAPAKWVAKLFAEAGLGLEEYPDWRSSLYAMPVDALRPLSPEQRARLAFLGCKRVADVAWLSLGALRGQFGEDGLRAHQAARGLLNEPVARAYPPGAVREALVFEPAEDSAERLNHALGRLAGRMAAALAERALAGQTLEVAALFEREDGEAAGRWRRTFARPIHDARSLTVALRLLLDRRLDAPVASLQVLLSGLREASRAQAELFRGLPCGVRERALLEAARPFGRDRVLAAGQVALSRSQRVLGAWREATGWVG
jgi:hypothetical protein